MRTDKLFYEHFQIAPQALFELLQITPGYPYRFESPVVKESEQRIDGLLEPTDPGYPYYFLEVQGYLDKGIYWRGVHQVGTFFHQRPKLQGNDWRLVVLFLRGH
jgi:predicted transposase YdaD